jgi:predicted nucleic acid-binding protein
MILVDTNVLVALVLRKDRLHARAVRDLEKHARDELCVPAVVLCEACFLLATKAQRARLRELLAAMHVSEIREPRSDDVFEWLERYADHEPDWVDGCLVVLAGHEHRIWTYDREFRAIWRNVDGGALSIIG